MEFDISKKCIIEASFRTAPFYAPLMTQVGTRYSNLKDIRGGSVSYYNLGLRLRRTPEFLEEQQTQVRKAKFMTLDPLASLRAAETALRENFPFSHILECSLSSDVTPDYVRVFKSRQKVFTPLCIHIDTVRCGQEILQNPNFTLDPKTVELKHAVIDFDNGRVSIHGKIHNPEWMKANDVESYLPLLTNTLEPLQQSLGALVRTMGQDLFSDTRIQKQLAHLLNEFFKQIGIHFPTAKVTRETLIHLLQTYSDQPASNPDSNFCIKSTRFGPVYFASEDEYLATVELKGEEATLFDQFETQVLTHYTVMSHDDRAERVSAKEILYVPDLLLSDADAERLYLAKDPATIYELVHRAYARYDDGHPNSVLTQEEKEQAIGYLMKRKMMNDVRLV